MATRFFKPRSMRTDYKCTFISGFGSRVVVISLGDEEFHSSPLWKDTGRGCRSTGGQRFPATDCLGTSRFPTVAALPAKVSMGLRDLRLSDRGGGKRRGKKAIDLGYVFAHTG